MHTYIQPAAVLALAKQEKYACNAHVSHAMNQKCKPNQVPLSEPTLQKVLEALQDPVGLERYCCMQDPHPNLRVVHTAQLQLLWKLQRNGGGCEYVGSDGGMCAYTVWDWIRCPVAWTQLEWHHSDGSPAVYIGQYRTPRTHTHTSPRLTRVLGEMKVVKLLCRDHHCITHLHTGQQIEKQTNIRSTDTLCVCVCVCADFEIETPYAVSQSNVH